MGSTGGDIHVGRTMAREIGQCIYCGALGSQAELTDEHLIPFALGADTYLKDASCKACAKITSDFETHVARNIFGHLRVHIGVQTRRPKRRPTVLPTRVVRRGAEIRLVLPVKDHPHFLVMPVWESPGIFRGEQPQTLFTNLSSHMLYYIPPNINTTLDLEDGELAKLVPDYRIDANQFARAIAKIGYCQAVALFGLDGFRPLALPDLILGKYTGISQFVGSELSNPPPPEPSGRQHRVDVFDLTVHGMRLLVARVRLFADSGTKEHGTPIYTAIVGAPNKLTDR
jgi:hypothetical protein